MRVVVFGASGPTGRLLVEQAGSAGHDVTAVVRRADSVRPRPGVRVAVADVTDPGAVERVVAGHDAVLSSLGTRPSSRPITIYSAGTAAVVAAMRRHGLTRLVAVSSSVLDPLWRPSGEHLFNLVLDPLVNRRVARTAHADMRRMEALLHDTALDWTVARPSGLFDHPVPTAYAVARDRADGLYTARVDLAAAMVAELAERRFVRQAMAVVTTEARPSLAGLVRREVLGRRLRTA